MQSSGWDGMGCSLIHEEGKPRGQMLIDMCREKKADGVISCMMKFCDPEEYDQPYFERDLRKAGISVSGDRDRSAEHKL